MRLGELVGEAIKKKDSPLTERQATVWTCSSRAVLGQRATVESFASDFALSLRIGLTLAIGVHLS